MSSPTLRVVADADESTPITPSASVVDSSEATPDFDPDLDLGAIAPEEDEPIPKQRNADDGGAIRKMFRWVLYFFGGIAALVAAGIMYLQSNSPSGTGSMSAPVVAKVDVLESARRNAEPETPVSNIGANPTPETTEQAVTRSNDQLVESTPPALESTLNDVVPVTATVTQPTVPYALIEEMRGTLASLQEITQDIRADIADQRTNIGRIQSEVSQLQTIVEEHGRKFDNINSEMAQMRRSIADINTSKTREARAQQRQHALQKQAAKELRAAPKVRPGFQLASVTQWGEDNLATFSFNGQLQVLGKGDVLDGWTITGITGNTVTVVRAVDGATATLVKGG